jgi:hypothetical protein
VNGALAIAAVTACLREVLRASLAEADMTATLGVEPLVTALPPDRVAAGVASPPPQLNWFLHQAVPNAAWRNAGPPERDPSGVRRAAPPLALDLHYLLTAHATEELHAEILLGHAMRLFHGAPVLRASTIRALLAPDGPDAEEGWPAARRALRASGLADQLDQVRIVPAMLSGEEMSRLWSAMHTAYRPAAAYTASVVLLPIDAPLALPLPVLRRAVGVAPSLAPPVPTLLGLEGPGGGPAAAPATCVGIRAEGMGAPPWVLRLEEAATRGQVDVPVAADGAAGTLPAAWPAGLGPGLYAARLVDAAGGRSNALGLAVRPRLSGLPANVARDASGAANLQATVSPPPRPGQALALFVGSREAVPAPPAGPATFGFTLPDAPAGPQVVRARVDGFDSDPVDRAAPTPAFRADATVTIT